MALDKLGCHCFFTINIVHRHLCAVQIKTLQSRNIQTSYVLRLCLTHLHRGLLLVSLSVSKQVKMSFYPSLYGIPAIPLAPIFLPANVIGGKQSQLLNATAFQIRPIYHMSFLGGLLHSGLTRLRPGPGPCQITEPVSRGIGCIDVWHAEVWLLAHTKWKE